MGRTATTSTEGSGLLTLGNLLELTLAGRVPDEKVQCTTTGAKLRWLGEGALELSPAADQDAGLDLVLSAGVHGCEIIPIKLLDRLVKAISRGEILPRVRLLLLFCNPPAMRRGVRLIAHDLNRLFNGKHANASGDEAHRAALLEALLAAFFREPGRRRWHYDLHSAMRASKFPQFAICPWVADREASSESLMRLRHAAVDAVLMQKQPSATFSAHTANRHGAEAFTLEVAEATDDVWPDCVDKLLQTARHWIEDAGSSPANPTRPLLQFRLAREIIKRSEQFALRIPADIENFAPVSPGTLLAEDEGGLRWVVEQQSARILFPMTDVAVGERAGLVVVPGN